MGGEEVAGVVDVVDVEHDETRRNGISGLARAIIVKTTSMRRDDRKLALEARQLVVIIAIKEFDLVADVLDLRLLHSKLDF